MKKRRAAQAVVIFAILLIPAFYAFIFLYAYWDPAGHMSNVPVAVVNCDHGDTVDGESKNIGKNLVDSLKSNNKVKWVFTDKKDADDGVLCQKYYAELIIPENFTKSISSASDKTKTQGVLYFKSNDKLGMMASTLLSNVSNNIEINISRSISQSIVDNLTNKLQALPSSMQKLSDGLAKLDDGSKQLQQGMLTLSQGQTAFNGGLNNLATGLGTANHALGQASSGSLSLSSGLNSAAQGASLLNEKSKSILAGDQKIYAGLTQLNLAIEVMKSSVDSSVSQLTDSTSSMQGLGQFVAQPVKLESTKIGEAENTGTALTPFMISLCLYIGGFMIMITIFSLENLKFKETNITQKIKIDFGLFRYQLIGIAQALLIAFVVHQMLGLNVQSAAQFYGICILGSLAFTTFIQVIIMLFKSLGKLLCLLFMMLQLTAGGGVMPSEILPPFYSSIHPYMPMTYTINALRNIILSIEPENYHNSIAVLTGIAIISALFVILLSFIAHKRKITQTSQIQHSTT